jgi:hypothetical protein
MGQANPPVAHDTNTADNNMQPMQDPAPRTGDKKDAQWEHVAKDNNLDANAIKTILCEGSKQGC